MIKIDHVPRLPQDLAISQDFRLSVAMGMYPGYLVVDKFGENPQVDTGTAPEDIWEGGGLYNYDADGTAPIVSLISDDSGDTQPIMVQGLDIDCNEVTQTITLTGDTRVALDIPLWRVYRMRNVGATSFAGTVYCYTGTGGVPAAAAIRAIVNGANNQTLMCIYTVPRGKVAFMFRGEVGASRGVTAGEARCAFFVRRFGGIFNIRKRVNLSNAGTSIYADYRSFPVPVPAQTDLRLTVESVSANGMGIFGTIDMLVVDAELFTDKYLTAIGQPA